MISRKVILTGSFGVGKTSLFTQFIYNKFDEKYLTTIGVKVSKKTLNIDDEEVNILLWDIAGEISQDKVPVSYFLGASGIIYVFDVSRPSTHLNIASDLEYLKKMIPDATVRLVANKKDLITEAQIEDIKAKVPINIDIFTSAKTGENVEELFFDMGKALI
jgi:small GTP-binding protein